MDGNNNVSLDEDEHLMSTTAVHKSTNVGFGDGEEDFDMDEFSGKTCSLTSLFILLKSIPVVDYSRT